MKKLVIAMTLVLALLLTACGSASEKSGTVTATDENLEIGQVVGGKYENKFFGIGCDLDENWTFYTEDQLAELSGFVSESLDNNTAKSKLDSGSTVFDMYAYADEGLESVNIVMENLGVLYGNILDENAYVTASMDQLSKALEGQGYENVSCESTTVNFAGAEHAGIKLSAQYQSVDF
ncbi:MAG: hypothetical protein IJ072_02655, partial [Oscillospiraceae bacterium]|nr:hypothetical protein [Oscillospiraceae bacterium]